MYRKGKILLHIEKTILAVCLVTAFSFNTANAQFVPIPSWPTGGHSVYTTVPTLSWYMGSSLGEPYTFDLRYSTDPTFTSNVDSIGSIYTSSFIVGFDTTIAQPLDQGTTYYWQVRSKDNSGQISAYSAVDSFYVEPGSSPVVVPTASWPTGGATVYNQLPRLNWYMSSSAGEPYTYDLRVSEDTSFSTIADSIYTIDSMSIVLDSTLKKGTKYYWSVRSKNSSGVYSDFSAVDSFVVDPGASPIVIPVLSSPIGGATVWTQHPQLGWYVSSSAGAPYTYDVRVSEDTGFTTIADSIYTIDSTSIVLDSTLKRDTKYYWSVRSKNSSGDYSDFSAVDSFYVFAVSGSNVPVPAWPVGGNQVYSLMPQLSWYQNTTDGAPYKFQVRYSEDSTFTTGVTTIGGLDSTIAGFDTTVSTPLTAGTKYYWQVRAKDNLGAVTNYSAVDSFVVSQELNNSVTATPSWPVGGADVYTLTPTLNWYLNAVGATTFDYEVIDLTANPLAILQSGTINGFNYVILTPLIGGHTYKWRVKPLGGSFSGYETFTVDSAMFSAAQPFLSWPVGGALIGTTSPQFEWYLNNSALSPYKFDLYYATDTAFTTGTGSVTNIAGTDTTVTGLSSNQVYYWKVMSTDNLNQTAWSAVDSFSTATPGVGAIKPMLAWPVGGANTYSLTPQFSWYLNQAASGVTYEIEIIPASSDFTGVGNSAVSPYTSGTLISGTLYKWRIKATFTSGTAYSDSALFTTPSSSGFVSPVIGSPDKNVVFKEGSKAVVLSWYLPTKPEQSQSYYLEVSKYRDFNKLDVSETMTNSMIFRWNKPENGKYFWRVRPSNASGYYSAAGNFTVGSVTTGLDDNKDNKVLPTTFEVSQNYPNPFNPSTVIKYSIPNASVVKITIYNILGQEIKSLINEEKPAGTYSITWDGRNSLGNRVASGAYIYRVVAGNFVATKKMILLK